MPNYKLIFSTFSNQRSSPFNRHLRELSEGPQEKVGHLAVCDNIGGYTIVVPDLRDWYSSGPEEVCPTSSLLHPTVPDYYQGHVVST